MNESSSQSLLQVGSLKECYFYLILLPIALQSFLEFTFLYLSISIKPCSIKPFPFFPFGYGDYF